MTPRKVLLLCATICLVAVVLLRWYGPDPQGWKSTIGGDGRGYYAYLPALFLHEGFSFEPIVLGEEAIYSSHYNGNYLVPTEGGKVNKYLVGEALLLLPFFLLAWLFSAVLGLEADGYSFLFQASASLAAITYFLLGIGALMRLLRYYKIREIWIALVPMLLLLGTNLGYYIVLQPSLTHVYSFSMISLFLLQGKRYMEHGNPKAIPMLGALFALILLLRPTNGLVLLALPFLAGSWSHFKMRIHELPMLHWKQLLVGAAIALSLVSIQSTLWYLQTGKLLVWSYQGEGFYFDRPALWQSLFSFQKGLLVYTPLVGVSLLGLISLWRRTHFEFWTALTLLIAVLYVTSSWWSWYYGDSFGLRPWIDYYAFFGLLLAIVLQGVNGIRRTIVLTSIGIFTVINLLQTYQYADGILHPHAMTQEKYWHIFLRMGDDYRGILAGDREEIFGELMEPPLLSFHHDFEEKKETWKNNGLARSDQAHSGTGIAQTSVNSHYCASITIKRSQLLPLDTPKHLKMSLWRKEMELRAGTNAKLVIEVRNKSGDISSWKSYRINDMPREMGKWWFSEFAVNVPPIEEDSDELKIYVWNPSGKNLHVDDFTIQCYQVQR